MTKSLPTLKALSSQLDSLADCSYLISFLEMLLEFLNWLDLILLPLEFEDTPEDPSYSIRHIFFKEIIRRKKKVN